MTSQLAVRDPDHLDRRHTWRTDCRQRWRLVTATRPRILAVMVFSFVLASSALTADAQPAGTAPLTVDSLRNATYLSILLDPPGSSHLVQLTDGNYPPDSPPGTPTYDADGLAVSLNGFDGNPDLSATGDLNGDGAQDIAAVFAEGQAGQNDVLFVLETYVNQNTANLSPRPRSRLATDLPTSCA
jgi:hypothetical protein